MIISKKASAFILLIILVLLGYYVISHRQDFAVIYSLNYVYLPPLLLCSFLQMAVNGSFLKVFMEVFGHNLCTSEWLGLAIVNTMGNYLVPLKSGIVGKAVYLKKKYDFAYTDFASITLGFYILNFLLGSLTGLLLLTPVYFLYGYLNIKFLIVLLLICAGMLSILQLGIFCSRINTKNKLFDLLTKLAQGWNQLVLAKGSFLKAALLIIANFGFVSGQYFFAYRAFNIPLAFINAWLLAVTSGLSIFFSFTPGNLGIQEAYVGFLSDFVGLGFNSGIVVAALMRVAILVLAFTLGPYFSYHLLKKINQE